MSIRPFLTPRAAGGRFGAVLLVPLWSCHVFSDGNIDQTCEDVGGCVGADGGDPDTDTDTDTDTEPIDDLEWDVGLALSTTTTGQWRATALRPPDLHPEMDRSGSGEGLAGPIAYDPPHSVMWVLAEGYLFGIGEGADVLAEAIPIDTASDICYDDGKVYVAAGDVLGEWSVASRAAREIENPDGGGWTQVTHVFRSASPGVVYFLEADGTAPDLWKYDSDLRKAEIVYEDYDSAKSRSSAGGFLGPGDRVHVCSTTGAVYAVDELAAGGTPQAVASVDTAVTDVVGCGWDPRSGRFLVFSATKGVLAIAEGEEQLTVVDQSFGTIAGGVTW